MNRWAIDIDRDDITQATIVAAPEAALPEGAIEVAVELFAMTANNVTYAALGKPMGLFGPDGGYWDFFADRDMPGRLPVWGFGTVTRSMVDGFSVGERLYGYWPMASHVTLFPGRINPGGFVDTLPRRAGLPAVYNRYQRLSALGDYRAEDHDLWPVFRPLYMTGWLIADQLDEAGDYGAEQVLVTAASSKTAMGFAHAFRQRSVRPALVAITSPASVAFLEASGLYDRIVTYDAIATLDGNVPTALIDIAGNPGVTRAVHETFGDRLALSLVVGKAHWDAAASGGPLPGPRQSGFFAPGRIEKRSKDWGGDGLNGRMASGWSAFIADVPSLTAIDRRAGAAGALAAWHEAVAGSADPRASVIVDLTAAA
ncbi:MAG: DUF2855 family protein [Sphingomonas sp.]|jgi:hypothetical protein|uniref:DUF2855 family protein n=1 Tax=Sphingomonas sp. TaxID=28214 RepID=UPI003566AF5F